MMVIDAVVYANACLEPLDTYRKEASSYWHGLLCISPNAKCDYLQICSVEWKMQAKQTLSIKIYET